MGPLRAGSRVPPVASYQMDVTVDAAHAVTGRETVRFVNRTSHSFPELVLHLYLIAWKNDRSTWLREQARGGGRDRPVRKEERWFGFSELNRVALEDGTDLTAEIRFIAPDDGNADDRTLAAISLPKPVR